METTLITGATSSIGTEIAKLLSESHNLILHGRDEKQLNELKINLNSLNDVYFWLYDFSDINDLEMSLKNFINENNLRVDKFVHCAGLFKLLPFKLLNTSQLQSTLNVNFISAFCILKVITNKTLNSANLNSVVFISSIISNNGSKATSHYAASKSALDGLMRNLAVEFAPGIRFNSVLPGALLTKSTKEILENPEIKLRMESNYPLPNGNTLDIANMVKFLLSDKASWITGQQFVVDGGRSINISA